MKKLILAALVLAAAATAYAGNVHKDGNGEFMQIFAPARGTALTTSATKFNYTPTAGTKAVRFQPSVAVVYRINGTGTVYPVAANTNEGPFGIATRLGVGTSVTQLSYSSAAGAKTVYFQEQ